MAEVTITARQVRAGGVGRVDRGKVAATTDVEIDRQMVEDGEDPAVVHDDWYPSPGAVRQRLGLTQESLAEKLRLPVATWRNWEQGRVKLDPIARSYLFTLWRIPETVMRSLERCPTCLRTDVSSEAAASSGTLTNCPECGSLHEESLPGGLRRVRRAVDGDRVSGRKKA